MEFLVVYRRNVMKGKYFIKMVLAKAAIHIQDHNLRMEKLIKYAKLTNVLVDKLFK